MILITFLIMGWLLTLFDFDSVIIHGMKEMFQLDVTEKSYWFIFLFIGLVLEFTYWVEGILD